jgi:RNA polymerase sigma-70 factor (ECF subfamily)
VAQSPSAGLAPKDERALHARLLAGDLLAPSELAEAYLAPLVARLQRAYPTVDPHMVESAVIDTLLDMAEHPQRYDPARGSLGAYLGMAARGDLRNALQSLRRRAAHQALLQVVELSPAARNLATDEADDPGEIVARAEPVASPELLAAVRAAFQPAELEIVTLMLEGERRTGEYARLLGLANRPEPEQRREVKRVKDRLEKRLRRLAPKLELDAGGEYRGGSRS